MYRRTSPGDWVVFVQDSPARIYLTNDFSWFTKKTAALVISTHYHLSDEGEETLLVLMGNQLWWVDDEDVKVINLQEDC